MDKLAARSRARWPVDDLPEERHGPAFVPDGNGHATLATAVGSGH
jgi:hypothetical protein